MNSQRVLFIFIPNTMENNKCGVLEGFHKIYEDSEAFFITNEKVLKTSSKCIGFVNNNSSHNKVNEKRLHFNSITSKITVMSNSGTSNSSIVKICYDYKSFINSHALDDNVHEYGKHFQDLIGFLKSEHQGKITSNNHRHVSAIFMWLLYQIFDLFLKICTSLNISKYSATLSHIQENISTFLWVLSNLKYRQLSPKIGNTLFAKVIDVIVGLYILAFFIEYETQILIFIEEIGEITIHSIKELLSYLMGSPIGLKLNHAFNNALGSFFFYHIRLWRVFLHGMHPFLIQYFRLLLIPGLFGISFQIAMLIDLLSFATFHVYCIYIYAAKLFQLQALSIVSLWRLFIGRKYNPLRERVDSCEYGQHQLFIGTLGFTILLFLLPTTTMYYVVFATLRIIFVLVETLLVKVKHFINCMPFYIVLLWLFNASSLSGTLNLEWKCIENDPNVEIRAKLECLPLTTGIEKFSTRYVQGGA